MVIMIQPHGSIFWVLFPSLEHEQNKHLAVKLSELQSHKFTANQNGF